MRASLRSRLLSLGCAVGACLLAFRWVPTLEVAATAPPPRLAPDLASSLRTLYQATLRDDYAWRQAAWLCNRIGPRLSGSPQAARAVEYVAAQLRALGLKVRLEPVTVPHWVRGVESAELVDYPGRPADITQRLVVTAIGGSVATPAAGLVAPVRVVDDLAALEAIDPSTVKGCIVLFNHRFDGRLVAAGRAADAYEEVAEIRFRGAVAAARKGAVGCLVRIGGVTDSRLPHTGNMRYADGVPKIPAASIPPEDAELVASLAAEGPVRVRLVLTPRTLPPVQSYNVVADLEGSRHPEEIVIVSGHLDSWDLGRGALDDAAGVAMAMQVGHMLCQQGLRPLRTVRVVAWMNEENGLAGGKTYAREHAGELKSHVVAMELDSGAGHPVGFRAHVSPAAMLELEPVRALLAPFGVGVLERVDDEAGSDVWPMDQAGVPTIGLLQDRRGYFDVHHTPADTLDKIDPARLAENAAGTAVMAAAVATVEKRLPR